MELLRAAFQKICVRGAAAILFLIVLQGTTHAQTREWDIKAAFVYNFAQFVEWPEEVFAETNSPIIIAVVGQNPFGAVLPNMVQGEKVNGRPLEFRHYPTSADLGKAHVLYVSQSEAPSYLAICRVAKESGALTVSDIPGFARTEGMVQFYMESNKVRFYVNRENAKAAGLGLSSKLLRLATIVKED